MSLKCVIPLSWPDRSLLCFPESFTADHKPLMGEAPEVRGFFLGCGFNSAGKRELRGSYPAGNGSQMDPGIPQPCLASWPHLHPPLFPRDDAGRWLWQGIGSLDHPRPAGEGHVRLRHQASHSECPSCLHGHPSSLLLLGDAPKAGLASAMGVQAESVSL